MVNTELDCGSLAIKFVNDFSLIWWDKGSGGDYDGAYYKPNVPSGFYALGSYGQANYSEPNGVVVVVKELTPGALAHPIDYELIWADGGSGADLDGAMWRPIPPNGYNALGVVATRGYSKPSTSEVMCVRQDLTIGGKVGPQVWLDTGTGVDKDFGSWLIQPPQIYGYEEYTYLSAGTFIGVASHTKPNGNLMLHCLKVKLPFEKHETVINQPSLQSTSEPPPRTEPKLTHKVWVPFNAVRDDQYGIPWKLENSPFYTLEREEFFTRLWHKYNNTSAEDKRIWENKVGISTTETQTMSTQLGISITTEASAGIEGIGSASVSTTLSLQLGFESSSSLTQMREQTITEEVIIPGHKAVAVWSKTNKFTLRRSNGTIVGNSWEVKTDSLVVDEFPD